MNYRGKIKEGIFISRPNRFIAKVKIDGREEICHVKNTGRCKEILVPGSKVYAEENVSHLRKTKYDVICAEKNNILINIDSQAPNKAVFEYLRDGKFFKELKFLKAETKYKNSRFDFYAEYGNKKAYIEVKGVTLEENGIYSFPDAPTLRGVKHLKELEESVSEGYEAYVFFVIQAQEALCFTPNKKTHPEFAAELKKASTKGVKILAFSCFVTKESISIKDRVEVKI